MVNLIDNHLTFSTEYGYFGAATSLMACIGALLVWRYWRRRNRGRNTKSRRILERSLSVGVLYGGQMAMKRLIDYHEARADVASLKEAEKDLRNLIVAEKPDFIKLQRVISKLEMSGKDHNAMQILEGELQKLEHKTHSLKAYEIEMLVAEMLIYMGEFRKALSCKCLNDNLAITDARRPLYKAIIYILSPKPSFGLAERYWKEFNEIREQFEWPPSLTDIKDYQIQVDFQKFFNVVKMLGEDIKKAIKDIKKYDE